MGKYKLTWKDLSWNDFKIYLFALFKAFVTILVMDTIYADELGFTAMNLPLFHFEQ